MSVEITETFYVYELIDPRDGRVFYVGKGKCKRAWHHEKEAERGILSHKCNKIRAIKKLGLEIQYNIVCCFDDEDAAYEAEMFHIKGIGIDALTNVVPGGRHYVPSEEDLAESARVKEERKRTAAKLKAERKTFAYKYWSLNNLKQRAPQYAYYLTIKSKNQKIMFNNQDLTETFGEVYKNSIVQFVNRLGLDAVRSVFSKYNIDLNYG